MNYIVFAFLLGACGVNGATWRPNVSLDDIRDFLNTTGTIYVYSTSNPNYMYDYSDSDYMDDSDEEVKPSCMQYQPKLEETDKYEFNLSYISNFTWHTKDISVKLGVTEGLGTPYMMEVWLEVLPGTGGTGAPPSDIEAKCGSKELRLRVYDRESGCALFYYVQSNERRFLDGTAHNDDLSAAEKFNYLSTLVTGTAAAAISAL
ncbi:uncharacterized protein LOC119397395 [Rhipicephalus sanguineus]|uniref:uncharacterized protein LOC119397395 n=1 Tax=Rhipicephalus sanguineus TaxID=34632 RepID=UPI0020C38BE9|nr:uncharacterized protein LOC119397395 [Rhipicephalus sanguineus]